MSKDFVPTERNVEKLLKDLSADNKPYPKTLLEARRGAYMSNVTAVISSAPSIQMGNGPGQGGSSSVSAPMTPAMKVILTALIAANLALATYLAVSVYENWDIVQEWLSVDPSVSETYPAPPEGSPQPLTVGTTPGVNLAPEGTVSPISTPGPTDPLEMLESSGGNLTEETQIDPLEPEVSTPEPDGKDNPGLHLGQTPHGPDDPPGQDNPQDPGAPPGQDNQNNNQDNNNGNQNNGKDKNK